MTYIFLLHATEDLACANHIRQDLQGRGYAVNDGIETPDVTAMLYPRSAKSVLVSAAAVIVLWSSNAARDERVWKAVRFARQLKRQVLPVTLDSTTFPETLPEFVPTVAQAPCDTLPTSLIASLPAAQSSEPLYALYQQAVDMAQPVRVAAIACAATLLQSEQTQGELLALLECLATDDPITSVREKAREIVNRITATTTGQSPPPTTQTAQGPLFKATCPDGHVCEYDKRKECGKETTLRGQHFLTCPTCGKMFYYDVDCRGY